MYNLDIILCFNICAIASFVLNSSVVFEIKDLAKSRQVLEQVIDPQITKTILSQDIDDNLLSRPGVRRKTVVMFADLNRFTSITERMEPEMVVQYINEFMNIADECIKKNGGTIDKFIGDCVMAFWEDLDGSGTVVKNACQTFIDIQKVLRNKNEEFYDKYDDEMTFSCGIGYGDAIVGSIGSKDRKNYTVTGDAVNIASRLQELSSKGYCYVSQSVYDVMKNCADIEPIPGRVAIRGKSKPIKIYLLRRMRGAGELKQVLPPPANTGYMLHICGCRGTSTVSGYQYNEFGGETSCYVIKKGDYAIVIDCGSGLFNARAILANCKKIDVVLTHVHYDHIMGFLDWNSFPKNSEKRYFGNFNEWKGDKTLGEFLKSPFWPVNIVTGEFISVERETEYILNEEVKLRFYKSTHPNGANVIVIDIMGKRVCIMFDSENSNDLPDKEICNAELVLFDGMYNSKNYYRFKGWGHSTWEDGVDLAIKKDVGRMIITHHDPRNDDIILNGFEEEAQARSTVTTFARQGEIYII